MTKDFKLKIMYSVLNLLIDLESLLWDIAEFFIYPTAKFRRWVAYRISLIINVKK